MQLHRLGVIGVLAMVGCGGAGSELGLDGGGGIDAAVRCPPPPLVASSGTFAGQRFAFAGRNTYAITAEQLDADCHLDVAVANADDNGVCVLLGNGDGTLKPQVAYPTDSFPTAVVAADLDGDKLPDLVDASDGVHVLINRGDGTFAAAVPYPGSATGLAATDLDRDGDDDLLSGTAIWLNHGDGTFAASVAVDRGGLGLSIVVADLDGDGVADLASPVLDATTVYTLNVMLGDGAGGLRPPVKYPYGGSAAGGIAAGDLEGDGDLDLVIVSGIGVVSTLLNDGHGVFGAPTVLTTGSDHEWVTPDLGDLDGDGLLDLAAPSRTDYNPPRNSTTVSVFRYQGAAGFAAPVDYTVGSQPSQALIRDADADGRNDLIVANQGGGVSVLLGNP